MLETELEALGQAKVEAIAARNRKTQSGYREAIRLLGGVIRELEALAKREDVEPAASEKVRMALADAYGMRGGVHRRLGDLEKALRDYEKGLQKERQESSYNLTNTITLGITLGRYSPTDEEMRARLREAIARLERETAGARRDEWWAWSDLGQFYLLLGEPGKARICYDRGKTTAPTRDEVTRHIEILKELAAATAQKGAPEEEKVSEDINAVVADLSRFCRYL